MIRILIIDDEPSAANMLQLLIEKHIAGHKEVRITTDPEEALRIIPLFNPGLLMLDIEMPLMNGFDLLNRLCSWDFDVIFTTAYDKYAIKAIRFSALDYLLKPIDIIDLQNAVNRHIMRKESTAKEKEGLFGNLISNLRQKDTSFFKLALSTNEGVYYYSPEEIIRCEGDDNYTHFHFTHDKPLIVTRTLKEFEEILAEHGFLRVHKSHLINSKQVTKFDKEGTLWLKDGSHVTVSRRKRNEIIRIIGK